jgi:hypothetical protein
VNAGGFMQDLEHVTHAVFYNSPHVCYRGDTQIEVTHPQRVLVNLEVFCA